MGDRDRAEEGRGVSSFLKTWSQCSWLGNRAGKWALLGALLSSLILWSGKQFEWKMKRVWGRKMGQKLKERSLGLKNSSKWAFLPIKRQYFIFPVRRQNEQQGLLLWQEHLEMCELQRELAGRDSNGIICSNICSWPSNHLSSLISRSSSFARQSHWLLPCYSTHQLMSHPLPFLLSEASLPKNGHRNPMCMKGGGSACHHFVYLPCRSYLLQPHDSAAVGCGPMEIIAEI